MRVIIGGICLVLLFLAISVMGQRGRGVSSLDVFLLSLLGAMLLLVGASGKWARWLRPRAVLIAIGTFLALSIVEAYVRVFDPFPILLRGGRIDLPVNSKRQFSSNHMPGLDETVSVIFNSIGFRGPEPPTDWENNLTILCVGGSTTQCLYLSDESTWPARLSKNLEKDFDHVWINNAGIDGHSTFGHLELLDQYITALNIKMLIFYVGLNDVDRMDLGGYDLSTLRSQSHADDSLSRSLQRRLLRNSDAFALLDSFRLKWAAKRKGLTHGEPLGHRQSANTLDVKPHSNAERQKWLEERDPRCLVNYGSRLRTMVQRCNQLRIDCVLMTQAVLYGVGKDDLTGMDLEAIRIGEIDGWTHWNLLQQYNNVTLKVGDELGAPVIDMANKMPKSSLYFYDMTHLNNNGADTFAKIVHAELVPILRSREQPLK